MASGAVRLPFSTGSARQIIGPWERTSGLRPPDHGRAQDPCARPRPFPGDGMPSGSQTGGCPAPGWPP
ncbi:MAG: hypothetical protein ACK56F_01515, partial [bacterium]